MIRTLKARPVSILHGALWMERKPASREMLLRLLTLSGFTGAGYATLTGRKSQESRIPIWGRPVSRDGETQCLGSPVGFFSRRTSRTANSTISAEAAALSNLADLGLRMQQFLLELLPGHVRDIRIQSHEPFPLPTPFGNSATEGESQQQKQVLIPVLMTTLGASIKLVLLTDSANAVAALQSMQPRPNDKLTSIILSYLRGVSTYATVAFCDAGRNIADAGTKGYGKRGL